MIKKVVIMLVALFSMVSFAVAGPAYGDNYITFNDGDVIRVDLFEIPEGYGMWDLVLYDFTVEADDSITVNGMIDLFCDNTLDPIYLTVTGNTMNSSIPDGYDNWNSLEMTTGNLGIMFEYGPNENTTTDTWYSHYSLNEEQVDRFSIYESEMFGSMTLTGWFDDNNEIVGMIGMTNAVPIPGAVWLLGSGLIGFIGITRRNS